MKNIFIRYIILFTISNFCYGQIASNLSFGIDELLNNPDEYYDKSICLFTNSGAITNDGLSSVEALDAEFDLELVFHLDSEEQLDTSNDIEEVYTLDLSNNELLDNFKNIDLVFIDIQNLGIRSTIYTVILNKILYACGLSNLPIVVLDRPNPLGGSVISGNIPQKSIANPFDMTAIPYRHGMTIGELARLLNEEYHHNAKLKIIPMNNWSGEKWTETQLQWKHVSPNISSYDKLKVFSISDLLVSDSMIENGRGDKREHQILVHPGIENAADLVFKLKALKLPGVQFFLQCLFLVVDCIRVRYVMVFHLQSLIWKHMIRGIFQSKVQR